MHLFKYDTAPVREDEKKGKDKQHATATNNSPSQPFAVPRSKKTRPQVSPSTFDKPQTGASKSGTGGGTWAGKTRSREPYRSNTWTSSNADINLISEEEDIDDRAGFVTEYNRLAKKYGIRPIFPGDFPTVIKDTSKSLPHRKGRWISRVLRQGLPSAAQAEGGKTDQAPQHRRSFSDLALNFMRHQRKAGLKNEDLQSLVRLCGKSILFLPAEYAPGSLVLPTCLRATGQYLIQHAETYGIFRVPGSIRVTNALYDYYCADVDSEDIATTTRCPNLPSHLNCGVHDVASTFKRILAGLPGGILGSLPLFDSLVAIHSQLHGYAEYTRTKESKLRARLIALAISTVKSQYQRELICAVFGLLCMVGRAAENAPREDESGRPLPTSELMGYGSLAIVFGPLLLGDLLDSYSMKLADPASGLIILPLTPIKSTKRRKAKTQENQMPSMLTVDRVLVANDITEMLLVHWRDIVRHMKELDYLHSRRATAFVKQVKKHGHPRYSSPEAFSLGNLPGLLPMDIPARSKKRASLPLAASPTPSSKFGVSDFRGTFGHHSGSLPATRRRPRVSASAPSHGLYRRHSVNALSPTAEESSTDEYSEEDRAAFQERSFTNLSYEPGKLEQLQIVSPSKGQCSPPSSGRASRASGQAADHNSQDVVPKECGSSPINHNSSSSTARAQSIELKCTPERTDPSNPSSLGTTRKYSQDTDHSCVDNDSNQKVSHNRSSTAGHTPLNNTLKVSARTSSVPRPLSKEEPDNASARASLSSAQQFRRGTNNVTKQLYLNENDMPLHGSPEDMPVLSEGHISPSTVEPFPSFRPSVIDVVDAPADHGVNGTDQDASRENENSNPPSSVDKSSVWSLRFFVGRKSPRFPLSEKEHPVMGPEEQSHESIRRGEMAPRWKGLIKSSPSASASKPKDKRVFRGSMSGLLGERRKFSPDAAQRTLTPDWKRQPLNKRHEAKRGQPPLSPEKKGMFERSQYIHSKQITPPKGRYAPPAKALVTADDAVIFQRSTSKPVSGSVKAMVTRFDSVSQDSVDSRRFTLNGRSLSDLCSSRSIISQQGRAEASADSNQASTSPAAHDLGKEKARAQPEVSRAKTNPQERIEASKSLGISNPNGAPGRLVKSSITRLSQGRNQISMGARSDDTPSKLSGVSKRPIGRIAARNEPQESPTKVPQRDQEATPPSLGSMIPHQEEPPVAQHISLIRRLSAASARSHVARQTNNDQESPLEQRSPRPGSGNSLLHQQIRSLQKQLESRNEEVQQLKRQLDTMGNIDVGTISEQLRQARRECKIWRQRAEAAERRLAVFERFTARFKSLRQGTQDAGSDEQAGGSSSRARAGKDKGLDSSSSCSNHTENPDVFKDRLRRSIKQRGRTGGDGVESPDSGVASRDLSAEAKGKSGLTARLWIVAEELLMAEEAMAGETERAG